MQDLLKLEDYSLSLVQATEKINILDRISFSLKADEILGLVGASGSGKSMTAKSILRLHHQLACIKEEGKVSINIDGKLSNLLTDSGYLLASKYIGIVFQQSAQVLNPSQKIGDQLIEKYQLYNKNAADQISVIKDLLGEVELIPVDRFYDAYPHQLSGGQIQRILIALSLIAKPKILIADEPLSALDELTQGEILKLLQRLRSTYNTSIIVISHDLSLMRSLCDRIVFLEKGRVLQQGPTEEIFCSPATPLIAQHVASHQSASFRKHEPLQKEVLFKLSQINKQFESEKVFKRSDKSSVRVFRDFYMEINAGEILGLIGRSGSGKSTLGRIVLNLESVDSGTVSYKGRDLLQMTKREKQQFRQKCQIIFQDPFSSMSPHRTVQQHFEDAAKVIGAKYRESDFTASLEKVDLGQEVLARLPRTLSGGQRQRVLIARALYMKVEFLVCDEILSSLDRLVARSILKLIKKVVAEQQLTVLFITHDRKIVEEICDRVVTL